MVRHSDSPLVFSVVTRKLEIYELKLTANAQHGILNVVGYYTVLHVFQKFSFLDLKSLHNI